jgi:3-hydroxyisobutyrate dehydrogenase-like beta-hydroxyacid dehydrogenase
VSSALRPGLIVVDTSTSEPATTAKMRDALAKHDVRFVDAPLARTPVEAEQGSSTRWSAPTTRRSPS